MIVDSTLVEAVKSKPEEIFQLIVRVEGDLDERQGQLEEDGFVITRRLRLIRGFAATAQGTDVDKVMDVEWIVSLELDQPVHTMNDSKPASSDEELPPSDSEQELP